ncbi:unnamed protein product [Hyaloperonospora brassicae]|uniref:Uncharacterized protein n=1 Tax=Hyaloperonospora brassicae TaxID=162125 RepID=A0AAV0V175_HYABA|nr:unnamed protein product [Hyaloperonospora brassicae]
MLAMNAQQLFAGARRPRDRLLHRSRDTADTTNVHDSDSDSDGDVLELDPVDGFPGPPVRVRPRRRFVKAGKTTYELSFSRRHLTHAWRGAAPVEAVDAAVAREGLCPCYDTPRPAPVVSSLSHVLTEVLSGQTKALNNIVDTTPLQPNVTYVVEHAVDGTPYVAASDGHKYFENSAIGQLFLRSVRAKRRGRGRQSDLSEEPVAGEQQVSQATRRSDGEQTLPRGPTAAVGSDGDGKRRPETLRSLCGFPVRKKREPKASAVAEAAAVAVTADDAARGVADAAVAWPASERESFMSSLGQVDRSRADASCEVPPVVSKTTRHGREKAQVDGAAGSPASTNDSDNSSSSGERERSSLVSPGLVGAPSTARQDNMTAKALPRLVPKKEVPAPPLEPDAYDEQDNPLCQSFRNVRNVDLVRAKPRGLDEDDGRDCEDDCERELDEEQEEAVAGGEDGIPDVNSPDFAGRVRVSSGATSVADFVGGFKGQLSRRSGASGLVNRKRAVRHARLTAEEQKAADLARKIREARNRVPLEFRDEHMSFAALMEIQKKRKENRACGRRVSFNPDVMCREFEVESEEEDDDGYDSPDEIVDAVQLVSKRDVVRAEDVVGAFPMEQLGLASDAAAYSVEASARPGFGADIDDVQSDPLTFSALRSDKRMSFSDL